MRDILSSKSFAGYRASGEECSQEDLTNAHILVVDDSRTTCALINRYLRIGGFNDVDSSCDGHDALKAISGRIPELVITDLLMPNLDGFELCRVLRAEGKTKEIPVLALTASADPDLRAQAFASGATDLLPKPFDPRELLSRVRILLERGRLIDRLSEFQKRIADELDQAASVQESLLPNDATLEEIRVSSPIDLAGHYEASAGLGGDLWGIEMVGDQRILVFSADFVGHGLGAALNTVRLHSFINGTHDKAPVPATVLEEANKFLCNVLPVGQFATMFCAVMDCRRRIIDYACAGAPPQLLRSAANRPFELVQEPGFPLGITTDAKYKNKTAPFAPGAMLILFSDALIETPLPPDSAFTPQSLREFVNQLSPESGPQDVRQSVLSEFSSRISVKPDDDLTFIALHFRAPESVR